MENFYIMDLPKKDDILRTTMIINFETIDIFISKFI